MGLDTDTSQTDLHRTLAYANREARRAEELRDENASLRAEVERLRAALIAVEWSSNGLPHDLTSHHHCPRCGRPITVGHAPGCILAAALAAGRG